MKKLLLLTLILFNISTFTKDFKGAELRTKAAYLYGRFEVRMKSPQKEGILASFFTYYDAGTGVATWNEIDIEILGRYSNDVQFNTITPGQINHARHQYTPFNPSLDYHTYAFEWTPAYVAWFIDGAEVYRQTGAHIATLNKAQKIMMNIWNPAYTGWVGKWNPEILPAFAYYDFVSYASYTPGAGSYGTNNNFTPQWKDEFDSWNTSRWDKATHTWDGNGSDFVFANCVFQDGKMILCLTDAVNLGYTDKKAPVALTARLNNYNTTKVKAIFSEDLDSLTASTKGNFIIPGGTVTAAVLLQDKRSVEVTVTGLDTTATLTLIVMNVKDKFSNIVTPKSIAIFKPSKMNFPIKINPGGGASLGYLPDREWSESVEYGFLDGFTSSYASNLEIKNTDEDAIYRDEKGGLATYKVRVPNGVYKISLMFVENYFNQVEKRKFDVFIEDSLAISDLDIFQRTGNVTAFMSTHDVIVIDEILDLHFSAEIENPTIAGIVINQISTGINEDGLGQFDFKLLQNYPNPFNGTTIIPFTISEPKHLTLDVHNILGEKIFSEDLGIKEAGSHQYVLNSNKNSILSGSGVYFYTIRGEKINSTKKLVILK